jgi:PHD/YefM family antitoxin component YafN of YafNO toxin-antitoxin module
MLKLVPQIEPVTRLVRDHKALFALLANGPVILAQHNKAAAVLVDVDTWNATLQRLAYLERRASAFRASARIHAGQFFTQEEVDAGFKELGFELE